MLFGRRFVWPFEQTLKNKLNLDLMQIGMTKKRLGMKKDFNLDEQETYEKMWEWQRMYYFHNGWTPKWIKKVEKNVNLNRSKSLQTIDVKVGEKYELSKLDFKIRDIYEKNSNGGSLYLQAKLIAAAQACNVEFPWDPKGVYPEDEFILETTDDEKPTNYVPTVPNPDREDKPNDPPDPEEPADFIESEERPLFERPNGFGENAQDLSHYPDAYFYMPELEYYDSSHLGCKVPDHEYRFTLPETQKQWEYFLIWRLRYGQVTSMDRKKRRIFV